jgi:hypothetical protein
VETNGRVERLQLTGRTEFLLERDPQKGLRNTLINSLFPDEPVTPPFATLLARSQATIRGTRRLALERIPWFKVFVAGLEIVAGLRDVVLDDVKWHSETGDRAPLRDYLRALVRMVLAEGRAAGVGHVRFEWSYPLALPPDARHGMSHFWAAVGREFGGRQPAEVTATDGIAESEAACRYLAANYEAAGLPILGNDLSIVIDIGGGSSDVGFWRGGQLLDQLSMKIAGNAILVPFCEVDGFVQSLGAMCLNQPGWSPARFEELFKTLPAVMLNALLTEVPRQADAHDPDKHPVAINLYSTDEGRPPWNYVRTTIYIFFTGLTFLVGILARRHIKDQAGIKLYLGGRGASLLTWLTPVSEKRVALLADAVNAGLGMDPPVKAAVKVLGPLERPNSKLQLKEEVVRGLLAKPLELGRVQARETTVLGESLWDTRGWDTEVTVNDLSRLDFPPTLDHGYMAWFLNNFLPQNASGLSLDNNNIKRLTRVDRGAVEHLIKEDQTLLQPILAYELRAVIMRYLDLVKLSGTNRRATR